MMTQKKKTFDAVTESRKWRTATSAVLAPMTQIERIEFLNQRISDFPKTRPKAQNREHVGS